MFGELHAERWERRPAMTLRQTRGSRENHDHGHISEGKGRSAGRCVAVSLSVLLHKKGVTVYGTLVFLVLQLQRRQENSSSVRVGRGVSESQNSKSVQQHVCHLLVPSRCCGPSARRTRQQSHLTHHLFYCFSHQLTGSTVSYWFKRESLCLLSVCFNGISGGCTCQAADFFQIGGQLLSFRQFEHQIAELVVNTVLCCV